MQLIASLSVAADSIKMSPQKTTKGGWQTLADHLAWWLAWCNLAGLGAWDDWPKIGLPRITIGVTVGYLVVPLIAQESWITASYWKQLQVTDRHEARCQLQQQSFTVITSTTVSGRIGFLV